jgi:hypothetical protein
VAPQLLLRDRAGRELWVTPRLPRQTNLAPLHHFDSTPPRSAGCPGPAPFPTCSVHCRGLPASLPALNSSSSSLCSSALSSATRGCSRGRGSRHIRERVGMASSPAELGWQRSLPAASEVAAGKAAAPGPRGSYRELGVQAVSVSVLALARTHVQAAGGYVHATKLKRMARKGAGSGRQPVIDGRCNTASGAHLRREGRPTRPRTSGRSPRRKPASEPGRCACSGEPEGDTIMPNPCCGGDGVVEGGTRMPSSSLTGNGSSRTTRQ